VVSIAKDEVTRMYCKINCGFHGQRWGCKNVLQDQLWFAWPKMRLQECTARSIVVSQANDKVSRMFARAIGEFWGLKNNFLSRVPSTYFNST
jgi:hypothetical protein